MSIVSKQNFCPRIYKDHVAFAADRNHFVRSRFEQISEGRLHFAFIIYNEASGVRNGSSSLSY